jgi:uncharacterized hydrophobic protein (TIGR00271 family)
MFLLKALEYFKLEGEVDAVEVIHSNMEKDVTFKGTNLWILVFAILVASVGLNMNSTAVIIGAMLISPLMGPITVMGYSIATYNFDLFRRAIKNFSFAVFSGLLASTIYFSISPVSTAHSELLARTTPTIYDVLIAFIGGLAGILAASSKKKGNVIPGVAIATALMPPLCTAGYGLATAQFSFFFGALYLFTINTVFIALAALIVSQGLKFPITAQDITTVRKKIINRWIYGIILVTLIPSVFFGYGLVKNEKFNQNAARFVKDVSSVGGNYLLDFEVLPDKKTISLTYGGNSLDSSQIKSLNLKLAVFGLEGSELNVKQGLKINDENAEGPLKNENDRLKAELLLANMRLDGYSKDETLGQSLLNELQSIYPQITHCAYNRMPTYQFEGGSSDTLVVLFLMTSPSFSFSDTQKQTIKKWAKRRIAHDNIMLLFSNGFNNGNP